jgi:hypothetical protein
LDDGIQIIALRDQLVAAVIFLSSLGKRSIRDISPDLDMHQSLNYLSILANLVFQQRPHICPDPDQYKSNSPAHFLTRRIVSQPGNSGSIPGVAVYVCDQPFIT